MDKLITLTKRALCAALGLMIFAALALPARAEAYTALLIDEIGFLTTVETQEVYERMQEAAQNAQCNIILNIGENLTADTERAHTEKLIDTGFGAESDSVALFLATNTQHDYDDWLSASGRCGGLVGENSREVLTAVYGGLDSGGWKGAALAYCDKVEELMTGGSSAAESSYTARLSDLQGVLSESDRESLTETMRQTANDIGCNVGVVITDDLGGKSDQGYADDFRDNSFGVYAHSAVFLFNNDRTNMEYADWISVFGRGQEMYENHINDIYKRVYDILGDDNYYGAINAFCEALNDYSKNTSGGSAGHYTFEYHSSDHANDHNIISMFVAPTVFAVLITLVIMCFLSAGYKRKKPVSAAVYCDAQRTRITGRSDVFLRQFTTCISTSSHHSSGHHSSVGGHHSGGGGHHSSRRSGGGRGRRR